MSIVALNNSTFTGSLVEISDYSGLPTNIPIGSLSIYNNMLYVFIASGSANQWYPLFTNSSYVLHVEPVATNIVTVLHNFSTDNIWFSVYDSNGEHITPKLVTTSFNGNISTITLPKPIICKVLAVSPDGVDLTNISREVSTEHCKVVVDTRGIKVNHIRILTSYNIYGIVDSDYVTESVDNSIRIYNTKAMLEVDRKLDVIVRGRAIQVIVESTNGDSFRPGEPMSTYLIAHVFENGTDITDTLSDSQFSWRRVSYYPRPFPDDDATWNALYSTGYKRILVTTDSVESKATFHCDLSILD